MPLDERSKGRFVVTFDEAAEQFAAKPGTVGQQHPPAMMFDQAVRRAGRQVPPSAGVPAHSLPITCRRIMISYTTFPPASESSDHGSARSRTAE
jgi:hypothetical protein